jgi:hypothetical protein
MQEFIVTPRANRDSLVIRDAIHGNLVAVVVPELDTQSQGKIVHIGSTPVLIASGKASISTYQISKQNVLNPVSKLGTCHGKLPLGSEIVDMDASSFTIVAHLSSNSVGVFSLSPSHWVPEWKGLISTKLNEHIVRVKTVANFVFVLFADGQKAIMQKYQRDTLTLVSSVDFPDPHVFDMRVGNETCLVVSETVVTRVNFASKTAEIIYDTLDNAVTITSMEMDELAFVVGLSTGKAMTGVLGVAGIVETTLDFPDRVLSVGCTWVSPTQYLIAVGGNQTLLRVFSVSNQVATKIYEQFSASGALFSPLTMTNQKLFFYELYTATLSGLAFNNQQMNPLFSVPSGDVTEISVGMLKKTVFQNLNSAAQKAVSVSRVTQNHPTLSTSARARRIK